MSSIYTIFQKNILEALHRDVSAHLGCDISHLCPLYYGRDIASICGMGKWFDRLLVDGHCSSPADSIFDTLISASNVARRFGRQWVLNRDACPFKVRAMKQYFDIFKKWEQSAPVKSDEQVLADFVQRVAVSGRPLLHKMDADLVSRIRSRVCSLLGPVPDLTKLVPRHGPGAVADGSRYDQKWQFSVTTEALRFSALGDCLFHLSDRHWLRQPIELALMRRWTSRSCVVPKDYRGGRVIAIEPKELQFLQQALKSYLYDRLQAVSHGDIQFTSQEFHCRKLHRDDSASLDLKDASDLVSSRLVAQLVPPEWWDLLKRLRSSFVVTGEKVTRIRSFALMGSALCFPIEALIHYSIVREACPMASYLSVYGDDIILPRSDVHDAISALSLCGLRVNRSKCCYLTPFRESCGTDLFGSVNVASVKLRRGVDSLKTALDAQPVQREFWVRGFYDTALSLCSHILHFAPLTTDPDPKSWELGYDYHRIRGPVRWNRDLQRLEVRLPSLCLEQVPCVLDEYLGLFSWFCGQAISTWSHGTKAQYVPSHLTRVKTGWTSLT